MNQVIQLKAVCSMLKMKGVTCYYKRSHLKHKIQGSKMMPEVIPSKSKWIQI